MDMPPRESKYTSVNRSVNHAIATNVSNAIPDFQAGGINAIQQFQNYQDQAIKSRRVGKLHEQNEAIGQQIAFARTKLLTSELPMQLRANSYLRLCCSAINKRPCYFFLSSLPGEVDLKNIYLSILCALMQYDINWWQQCQITDDGVLLSDNPAIAKFLAPIAKYVRDNWDYAGIAP